MERMESMRGRLSALVMAACLLVPVAGCAKSSTSSAHKSESSTSHPTTTVVKVATDAQLKAALLSISDMPVGWAAGEGAMSEAGSTTTTVTSSSSEDFLCPAARSKMPPELATNDTSNIEAAFNKGTLGPLLYEDLGADPNATTLFTQVKQAVAACAGQTWTETDPTDGTKTTYTLSELSFGALGDDHGAYRLSGAMEGGAVTVDLVFIRKGHTLALFAGIGTITVMGSGSLDSTEFSKIVATGVRKLPS
jgi:hypothetical protein